MSYNSGTSVLPFDSLKLRNLPVHLMHSPLNDYLSHCESPVLINSIKWFHTDFFYWLSKSIWHKIAIVFYFCTGIQRQTLTVQKFRRGRKWKQINKDFYPTSTLPSPSRPNIFCESYSKCRLLKLLLSMEFIRWQKNGQHELNLVNLVRSVKKQCHEKITLLAPRVFLT